MPAESTLRIAVAALRVERDPARNLARILALISRAAAAGAELVCFPEYSLRPMDRTWVDPTAAIDAIRARCLACEVWAVFGADAGGPEDRLNSLYVIDPVGGIRYRYDKVHLWGREAEVYRPGAPSSVIDIGPARLAVISCWDLAFPRYAADLAEQGADVILCCSYLVDSDLDAEPLQALPLARAFENRVFCVLCDAVTDETLSISMVCHPLGVRQRIAGQEGLLVADLDVAELKRLRAYYADPGQGSKG